MGHRAAMGDTDDGLKGAAQYEIMVVGDIALAIPRDQGLEGRKLRSQKVVCVIGKTEAWHYPVPS